MSSTIKYGTVGFFAIPDAGLWVPLYDKGKRKNAQDVVDDENSALICRNFKGGHCDYVADHAGQGFNKIKHCSVNTMAFIQNESSTQCYYCVGMLLGTNTGKDLITCSNQKLSSITWADLCAYCCNDETGKSITMVLFKKGMRTDYPMFKEWFM